MKIIWTDGIAGCRELPFENQNITAAPGRVMISLEDVNHDDELAFFINDQRIQLAENNTSYHIPCAFEKDGVADILIYIGATRVHIRAISSLNLS